MREAFDVIAPRYDLVSSVMTLGMGDHWRRAAAEAADVSACSSVLDAFTGTGDLALMLADRVASDGEVIGVDYSPAMIDRARLKAAARGRRCRFEVADVLSLPFDDNRFDAVTASGGLRGLDDPAAAVREMVRVARPGARIVVLEITPPRHLRGIHHAVLNFAMPAVGGLLGGNPDAFGALAQSVGNMPPPVEVAAMLSRCGIADIRWREFAAGMATLHYGRVATA
jgi:demethylmenaquinone methyltransferase/2-methoxy-6-polyprenyl-1,4-benzoquinol methylase